MPEVNRYNSGLAIQGERFRVTIQPCSSHLEPTESHATLLVTVDARSPSWGDEWARVSGDIEIPARPEDVRVTQTAGILDVLQVLPPNHKDLPEFRTGFTLTLEPGMREAILAALPRVERVAQLTIAVGEVAESLLGRTRDPYPAMRDMPHAHGDRVAGTIRMLRRVSRERRSREARRCGPLPARHRERMAGRRSAVHRHRNDRPRSPGGDRRDRDSRSRRRRADRHAREACDADTGGRDGDPRDH